MVPGESCGFSGIVGAEGAGNVTGLEGRADDVDRVPVGLAHDELGTGVDIDQGFSSSSSRRAACSRLSPGFGASTRQAPGGVMTSELEKNGAGRPVTNKHAGGDQEIVWVDIKRVCRN